MKHVRLSKKLSYNWGVLHFLAFHCDRQSKIDRFVTDLAVLTAFDDNAVEINNRIDRIEWSALPCPDVIEHGIGNTTDKSFRDFDFIEFQQHGLHIPDTYASGIHGQDFLIKSVEPLLALRDQLWFKGAVSVSGRTDFQLIVVNDYGFAAASSAFQGPVR